MAEAPVVDDLRFQSLQLAVQLYCYDDGSVCPEKVIRTAEIFRDYLVVEPETDKVRNLRPVK